MRKRHFNLEKRLRQYSMLVAPMLATAGITDAQIIYHDVEPDAFYKDSIAGDAYTTPHFLDLDGDGIYDVKFAVWSSVQSDNGPEKVNLAAAAQYGNIENAIMGYTNLFSASFCSTPLPLYCPSALNTNKIVGPLANFWAMQGSNSLGTLVRYFKNKGPNEFAGQWNNVTDKYIGLRFKGDDGSLHYGWIRMDVTKSPASVTVKDYAYEVQNGVAIKAGDAGNVLADLVKPQENFDVICEQGIVTLLIKDKMVNDASVALINLSGQICMKQLLKNSITRIDLHSFAKGIYLVSIQEAGENFSKKIILQ